MKPAQAGLVIPATVRPTCSDRAQDALPCSPTFGACTRTCCSCGDAAARSRAPSARPGSAGPCGHDLDPE